MPPSQPCTLPLRLHQRQQLRRPSQHHLATPPATAVHPRQVPAPCATAAHPSAHRPELCRGIENGRAGDRHTGGERRRRRRAQKLTGFESRVPRANRRELCGRCGARRRERPCRLRKKQPQRMRIEPHITCVARGGWRGLCGSAAAASNDRLPPLMAVGSPVRLELELEGGKLGPSTRPKPPRDFPAFSLRPRSA